MRIPDVWLNCVGFIGEVSHEWESSVEGDLCATGFFVSIPCESSQLAGLSTSYFITAKHVANDLKDRRIYFLVNRKGGGVTGVKGNFADHWLFHPTDPTADVAAIQISPGPDADVKAFSIEGFGIPQRLEKLGIGIGDEVFITGLFTAVPGTTKNCPIIRHGNIAMMPTEQIDTELGYADVFLIEVRSIGGLSGSPVFVRNTMRLNITSADGSPGTFFGSGTGETLLGLMHGHWDIKESEMNKPNFSQDRKRGVNMGIAIVVPAIKIYETLYDPKLVKERSDKERIVILQQSQGGASQ